MSNIYIQEPPTYGKVLLKTNFGEIDVELWARETPKACRNFVQLCLEGFYNNVIFHRVIKGFIAQTGDPAGTGTSNESIYGAPFKDEIHSRLRFNRRGLVALANCEKNDNGCQFFFTLGSTPELQGKHTIFGKVVGDTIFNLLKLDEVDVDKDDRPVYEHKIVKTEVLNNPFTDIVPRVLNIQKEPKKDKIKDKKNQEQGVKNFKLLSFGEEAEEDEIETSIENKKFVGKSKSIHDVLNDPKLSSKTISEEGKQQNTDSDTDNKEIRNAALKKDIETVKNKLKSGSSKKELKTEENNSEDDNDLTSDKNYGNIRKLKEIKEEIKNLKREYHQQKKQKVANEEESKKTEKTERTEVSEVYEKYIKGQEKYMHLKKKLPIKNESRNDFIFSFAQNFKERLQTMKRDGNSEDEKEKKNEEDMSPESIWKTPLECNLNEVLAKDANTKTDNWYEIDDPRNPINKRRRETSKQQPSGKEKHGKYDL